LRFFSEIKLGLTAAGAGFVGENVFMKICCAEGYNQKHYMYK
jgi:hypothetical protein